MSSFSLRQIFIISLIVIDVFCSSFVPAYARILLKSGVERSISEGIKLHLQPETIFDSEISIAGDYFSAFFSPQDCKALSFPMGTKLIGEISEIKRAKSLNRDSKIYIDIEKLMFPTGESIKAEGKLVSKPPQKSLKKIAREVSQVGASSLVGAKDAVAYSGIPLTVSSYGLNAAVGGAIGLTMGLFDSLKDKGNKLVSSFDPIRFKLLEDFVILEELPLMAQDLKPFKLNDLGIDLKLNKVRKAYSTKFGDYLVLDLDLTNNSHKTLYSSDFVLRSGNSIIPILNNPILSTHGLSATSAHQMKNYQLAFSVNNFSKKNNYELLMIDPISSNVIAEVDVDINKVL